MAHYEKQTLFDAVRDALKADSTVNTWAGMIVCMDTDPTQHESAQARTRGNYIMIRDGGALPGTKGMSTREYIQRVDIAICAGMKQTRLRDGSGRTVLAIEDDIRRVLTDARTIYSASGVSILEATIMNSPPTATVWGDLFQESLESGFRMAIVQWQARIMERR